MTLHVLLHTYSSKNCQHSPGNTNRPCARHLYKQYRGGPPCNSMSICVGFHRFLAPEEEELRRRGAQLNPKTFLKPRNEAAAPEPIYSTAEATAPAEKTNAFMRQSARESDLASAAGTRCKQSHHPQQQTGVHASHAMQKVPGFDDEGSRKPDPMHTIGNEVTAVTVMAQGGTAAIARGGQLGGTAKQAVGRAAYSLPTR